MVRKYSDLCVKTGEYEKDGQMKNRYINIGSRMINDDGGKFILINRTFNPAGVPNPLGKSSVIVYEFPIKEKSSAPEQTENVPSGDDDIPF